MRVTVREAAALLRATERQVYDWIESGDLPAYRISDQYRINRSELLEWATARNLPVAAALFEDDEIPSVSAALERGGVHHDVGGATRDEALRAMIRLLELPDEGDREALLSLLLARDAEAAVPIGNGVAIPHVRHPIALATDEPSLTLCFLKQPVDLKAPDRQPVHALFFLVSPNTRAHLAMLARLAHVLRQPPFQALVRDRAPAAALIQAARSIEEGA